MPKKTTLLEKLEKWSIPEPYSGCRIWTGFASPDGYGKLTSNGIGEQLAHRAAYVALKGPIPEGMSIDHLCRTTLCINPDHMEPVPIEENIRRGMAGQRSAERRETKTHCIHGHEYTPRNTAWYEPTQKWYRGGRYRTCLKCRQRYNAEAYQKRKAQKLWQQSSL